MAQAEVPGGMLCGIGEQFVDLFDEAVGVWSAESYGDDHGVVASAEPDEPGRVGVSSSAGGRAHVGFGDGRGGGGALTVGSGPAGVGTEPGGAAGGERDDRVVAAGRGAALLLRWSFVARRNDGHA